MKTLYLTDLDGTFLNNNAKVSENSARIINNLIKQGLLFSIATARTYATVVPIFDDVNLQLPLVLMNGVCIYDPVQKRTLKVHEMTEETGKEVKDLFSSFNKNPLFYFEQGSKMSVHYSALDNKYLESYVNEREAFFNKEFLKVPSIDFKNSGSFVYVVTLDKKEHLERIHDGMLKIKGLSCNFYKDNYTGCYFLEAMKNSISKASGAVELKSMLGIDRIVAFGDNVNDIPLFKLADECYAVENACDELKSIATGVIGTNDSDAVARFINEHFLKERRKSNGQII